MPPRKGWRFVRDPAPPEPIRSQIISALIAARKQGLFDAVWIDADVIRTRTTPFGTPHRMSWKTAAELLKAGRGKSRSRKVGGARLR